MNAIPSVVLGLAALVGAPVEASAVLERALAVACRAPRTVDVWIWCHGDAYPGGIGPSADAAREAAVAEAVREAVADGVPDDELYELAVSVARNGCAVRVTVPDRDLGVQILSTFTHGTAVGRALRGGR